MRGANYTKAIVIVHGKSEYDIVKYIKSKLRIPMEPYSRDNGRSSIEISSLKDILNNQDFFYYPRFTNRFPKVECDDSGETKKC